MFASTGFWMFLIFLYGFVYVSVVYLNCGLIKFERRSLKWEGLLKQLTLGVKFIGVPFFHYLK